MFDLASFLYAIRTAEPVPGAYDFAFAQMDHADEMDDPATCNAIWQVLVEVIGDADDVIELEDEYHAEQRLGLDD